MGNTQQVEKINSSNRLKKTLSICILGLLLFLILTLVYEYFRIVPENVVFSNVTSTSVTVSWNTKNPISATAVYKKGDGGFINLFGIGKQVFYDTRDLVKAELKAIEQTSKNIAKSDDISVSMSEVKTEVRVNDKGKYYTHHVEIKGLDPETEYSFFVGDEILYRAVKDIDGNTVIKTTKVDESVKTPVPAYGSIYDSMNTELTFDQLTPISDGIVYFNYVDRITGKKSNLFSGVLNEEGNWYIDVAGAVDDEGKPFMDTYDTVEGNVYVELNINAGNLGIWRKTESAYVLTPATNTVINMPNAIVDPTIEGSVVRIEGDVQTSVKGASDNLLARFIGDDEQDNEPDDEPNYVPPCKCPSDYPDRSCPSGKVCQSKVISGTSYCSKTTCYRVKVTTPPTETPSGEPDKDCSYFSTFDCTSDCYYLNSSGNYVECEPKDCNMERLKALGLDCDDDPNEAAEQENNTCAGGAKLGQCTYVQGEGCKQCKWIQNKGGGYMAVWSGVSEGLCGIKSQSIQDCRELPNCTDGKLNLKDNTCICNTGYQWDTTFERCVKINTNTCSYPGQTCYINGKRGNCTVDNKEGYVCKQEPEKDIVPTPTPDPVPPAARIPVPKRISVVCTKKGPTNVVDEKGRIIVCNEDLIDVPVGVVACRPEFPVAHGIYHFNIDGDCALDSCKNPYILVDGKCELREFTVDMPCDANGLNMYWIKDSVMYQCSKTKQKWVRDYWGLSEDEKACNALNLNQPTQGTHVSCSRRFTLCITKDKVYQCWDGRFLELGEEELENAYPVVFAEPVEEIPQGESCKDDNNGCKCKYRDRILILSKTEWCPVEECTKEGQVCETSGTTCTLTASKKYKCNGPQMYGSSILRDTKSLISSVVNLDNTKFHILAESKNTSNNFMIDQKEGMFVDIQDGQYIFEYDGEEYYFSINDMSGSAKIVIDKNNNNQYDEGTDILVSDLASIVQIEPIELKYTYVLKQGFNFVSFPFLVSNQEYRTAAGLLKKLNDVYEDTIYSIAKYDGSWKVVGQNIELYSSNDFQLLPGQGYIIKVKDDVTIDIWGKPIKYDKDSPNAPIAFFKGWNLVGLYGSGIKQYTAKTLLEDINKYEKIDFSADNVSKWDNELQRYEGFQVADKNGVPTEYGFNYVIDLLNSYFIRVQDGEGNWQPELAQ